MSIPAQSLEEEQAKSINFFKVRMCLFLLSRLRTSRQNLQNLLRQRVAPFLLSHLRTSRHNFQNLLYCYNTSRQSSQEFSKAIHKEKSSKKTIRKHQKSIKVLTFVNKQKVFYLHEDQSLCFMSRRFNSFNGRG